MLILDYVDAVMSLALRPAERRFACAILEDGRVLVWAVVGFGGKVFPLVYSRAASFASRSAQAMVVDTARLQLFVDDPAVVAWGPQTQVDETLDLVVIW